MHGVQRVQEILMRAMREGAGGQMALARSMSGARDAADISRAGEAHAGPAAEQFTRFQQELIGAVTEMNTEMVQASYSMMERVSQALGASSTGWDCQPGARRADRWQRLEAGMRQWQGAMEQPTQGVRGRRPTRGTMGTRTTRTTKKKPRRFEEPQPAPGPQGRGQAHGPALIARA